jgi:signal transduction histidine kinase
VFPPHTPGVQATRYDPVFRRAVLISILVLAAYYLTAKIGFEFILQPGSISTLWMPNSLLLAGLLLTTPRWWWLVILAALPAHLASELQGGIPTAMILSWFVSNTVQALIGALLIHYFIRRGIRFDSLKDLVVFLICGAFLAPFLSSFLDSALVKLNGWGNSTYWDLWRLRFLSNVLATLTLVPFIITWVRGGLAELKQAAIARVIEGALLLTALFAMSFFVFDTQRTSIEQTPSRLYWPLPFLVWATVRFGLRGVSLSLLIVMFLAIVGATRNTGPFVASSSSYNAVAIQGFLIVVSVPLIVLAAVIEERRLTEAIARDNEERLTLALNAAQMVTWDWRIEETTETNSQRTNVSSSAHVLPASFFQMIHPDDREFVELAVSSAIKTGTPYEVEFRVIENGGARWFLSKGKIFFSDTGKPVRLLGVGMDITGRKGAEQALDEINERNQAILRAIPDTMFLQNKEGLYLDYHARDKKGLLVPPEEFLGRTASEVLPHELSKRVHEIIARLDNNDQPQVFEYSLRIGDEDRHYEARLVNAENEHVLSMVRDITEARRATEAARQNEEQLRQRTRQVQALAARLMNAQESERRRISRLLHDDVGQNVAALGLAISRLKRRDPEASPQMAAELERLGTQIHDLTAQIRQLSHELHPEILEQVGLAKALESHIADFSREENIVLNFASDLGVTPIPADIAVCLYRVALEAVRNISKHSGANSATVALKDDDGVLELHVADPGQGFDVDVARHGSGLGLISSEERIRLLGGTFNIQSTRDCGTSLTARIPLLRHS